ncbi:NADPH:quinone reductase-like Zn-dependent oxidoreductase [Nonomuraea thailandensis]|uniref:NADPH:quinone reductase-like Zn-dependent oxidoreductase n=1 Tax=Nonomuraea thailandensis TaxID=1188745 RepID=A0A9X2G6Q5_9ACTN|nr:NADP-dependent oxidoreductase [Nonomuraea thailandensis]MCP2353286.1 NADPH:quinone reductase-like Zn-dependent oxidoreductase [Nonomuraea thailandensis]
MDSRVQDAASGARVVPQMNAVVLDRFGGIDELSSRRIPRPEVGDDDVLIRVEYAGVASWDAVEREGYYDGVFGIASAFPYVLGWDAAGTVAAVGRNVTRFEVGERVYAATMPASRGGFYAEYGLVEAEFVARVPDRMPTEQAGAMAWDALTALSGLDLLGLRPDETLMVFGASGGVGHMAVQLARHSGIRVLAVASGDDGVTLARRLGTDDAIDGRKVDVLAAALEFAPGGLDAALVTAGGETAERSLRAVKDSGRIAWPNGVVPDPVTSPAAKVIHYDGDRIATDRLNAIIEASSFEVHIARTFPMARVADAHRALNDHYVGKLALKVG